MTEFDAKIRRALQDEVTEIGDLGAEPSIPEMIAESFRGTSRWLAAYAMLKMAGAFAVATIAAVAFFQVESARAMIGWAAVFTVSGTAIVMWWMWYWMLINRNSELREIKRLELQIARLASRFA